MDIEAICREDYRQWGIKKVCYLRGRGQTRDGNREGVEVIWSRSKGAVMLVGQWLLLTLSNLRGKCELGWLFDWWTACE